MGSCCCKKKSFKTFRGVDEYENTICSKLFRRPTIRELTKANTHYHQSLRYSVDQNLNSKLKKKHNTVLRKVFTLPALIFFAISGTIGSGIYIIAGSAGKEMAGSSLIFSMFIAGFVAFTNALVIAEFASRVPLIGGDYTYSLCSSGEFIGFILGWFSLTKEPLGNAISALAVTYYLRSFLVAMNIINTQLHDDENDPNSYWFGKKIANSTNIRFNITAPILVIISCIIVYRGIKISKRLMTVVAIWNMSLLLLFSVSGSFLVDTDIMINPCDHVEFGNKCNNPSKQNRMMPYGVNGVITAAGIAFWSFLGPESIVYIAEECVNPTRDIPRAIYISYGLIFVLYTFVITVLVGMVPFQSMDEYAPLAEAFSVHGENLLMGICSLGALTAITGVFFQSGVGAPRIYLRLSIDGMIPKFCKYIHPTFRTPTGGILYFFGLVLVASALLDLTFLLQLYSSLTLILMALLQCSLLVMRFSPPSLNDHEQCSYSYSYSSETSRKESIVYITPFWTHKKVLGTIYAYFVFSLSVSFTFLHREFFFDNEIGGIWITLMFISGVLFISTCCLTVYFHLSFPWLSWLGEYEKTKIFWVPFAPYLNLIAIFIMTYLLALLIENVYIETLGVSLLGILFYFSYSYNNSNFRKEKKKLISRSQSI